MVYHITSEEKIYNDSFLLILSTGVSLFSLKLSLANAFANEAYQPMHSLTKFSSSECTGQPTLSTGSPKINSLANALANQRHLRMHRLTNSSVPAPKINSLANALANQAYQTTHQPIKFLHQRMHWLTNLFSFYFYHQLTAFDRIFSFLKLPQLIEILPRYEGNIKNFQNMGRFEPRTQK